MANFEFVSVLKESIEASGECIIGVAVAQGGEIRPILAGRLAIGSAEELSRELISLAAKVMSAVCKQVGNWPKIRRPAADELRAQATPKTFDIKGAAAILHMSPWMLGRMASRGVVPAAKVGRRWIFADEALAEYLRGEIKKQTAERRGEPKKMVPDPTPYYPSERRCPRPPPPLPPFPSLKPYKK